MKLSANPSFTSFDWLWVDGACQTALVKWLKLRSLPVLVFYDKVKNRFLTSEDFLSVKLIKFLSTVQKNKKHMVKLDEQLDLEDKKCSQIRQFKNK
jgi:tRNA(Phe) wybutosine-synthesizing methylase Tyw3